MGNCDRLSNYYTDQFMSSIAESYSKLIANGNYDHSIGRLLSSMLMVSWRSERASLFL
jgi:hypothetical protein